MEKSSIEELEMPATLQSEHAPTEQDLDKLKTDSPTASDNDGGEKITREKLKKTSLAALANSDSTKAGRDDKTEDEVMHSQLSQLTDQVEGVSDSSSDEGRGRPTKKRSFDDLQAEGLGPALVPMNYDQGHRRKKSRDVTSNDGEEDERKSIISQTSSQSEDQDDIAAVKPTRDAGDRESATKATANESDHDMGEDHDGPKKKRSRDQFDQDQEKEGQVPVEPNGAIVNPPGEQVEEELQPAQVLNRRTIGEPEKKRHRDSSLEDLHRSEQQGNAAKRISTSGFSNTSTVSPFGSLAAGKSVFQTRTQNEKDKSEEHRQTSPSAFAASGFAAHSTSNTSPFGALSASTATSTSGFGFGSADPPVASVFGGAPAKSVFGVAPGKSTFGAAPSFATIGQSGFGKLGGSGFGDGGGLSSFASPGVTGIQGASNKTVKPFGAPVKKDNEENDSSDEEEEASDTGGDEQGEHHDGRFHAQTISTGEEDETTLFVCKGKLLFNDGNEWKERGIGTFKLNGTGFSLTKRDDIKVDDEAPEKRSRIIMRSEGVMRVILNSPIFKGMKIGTATGTRPEGKMLYLTCIENGKPVPLVLKTGNAKYSQDFYDKVQQLQNYL